MRALHVGCTSFNRALLCPISEPVALLLPSPGTPGLLVVADS